MMYKCCFPDCNYETENRSLIEFHHIHLREKFNRVGKKVTIPLCPNHHNLVYHEDATSGQHSEKHPDSMIVKQVTNTNKGNCVIFEDMEGNEHISMLNETRDNGIRRISWDIINGITDEEPEVVDEAIARLVDDDGYFDDSSSVYYREGYMKIAKDLLAKFVEHYMTRAKSEYDLALEKARNDWKELKTRK